MIRSLILLGALSSTSALAATEPAEPPPTARAAACVPPSMQDATWDGLGVLKGGKGYAPTPMGQVHYRLMGPKTGPVVLLIHPDAVVAGRIRRHPALPRRAGHPVARDRHTGLRHVRCAGRDADDPAICR